METSAIEFAVVPEMMLCSAIFFLLVDDFVSTLMDNSDKFDLSTEPLISGAATGSFMTLLDEFRFVVLLSVTIIDL